VLYILSCGSFASIYAKTGDIDKAAEAFQALRSSDKGVDEKAYSHMIHCYGTAGFLPLHLSDNDSHALMHFQNSYVNI
jgi:hypothetical protein